VRCRERGGQEVLASTARPYSSERDELEGQGREGEGPRKKEKKTTSWMVGPGPFIPSDGTGGGDRDKFVRFYRGKKGGGSWHIVKALSAGRRDGKPTTNSFGTLGQDGEGGAYRKREGSTIGKSSSWSAVLYVAGLSSWGRRRPNECGEGGRTKCDESG